MYWYWLVSGLLLILFEFAIPGLVICFFGVSALIVGGLKYFFPVLSLAWQLIIVAFGGLAMAIACRLLIPRGVSKRSDLKTENIDNDDVENGVYSVIPNLSWDSIKANFAAPALFKFDFGYVVFSLIKCK